MDEAESPLAVYQRQLDMLTAIAERLTDPTERELWLLAVSAFRGTYEQQARFAEERLHIQHYCGICYRPIPIGEDVKLHSDRYQRRAHKSCNHLYGRSLPFARRQIEAGNFHEPGSCFYKNNCPLLTEIPTMGEQPPANWSEEV